MWPVQVSDNLVSPNFSFKTLDSHPRTPELSLCLIRDGRSINRGNTHTQKQVEKKGGEASVDGLPAV